MDETLRRTWAQYAVEVERGLGELPAELDPWIVAFSFDLGRPSLAEAPLYHLLLDSAATPPVLEEPSWVLDDLGGPGRADVAQGLFLATYHLCASAVLEEMVLAPESRLPAPAASVAALLSRRGLGELHALLPAGDPLWALWRARDAERVASALSSRDFLGSPRPLGREALYKAGGLRWSAAEIVVAAAASLSGHSAPEAVADLARTLHRGFQIHADLLDVGRAAASGARTFPLVVLAEEAGLDPRAPDAPERLLGAAVMSSALPRALDALCSEIASAAGRADALALPTFAARLRAQGDAIAEIAGGFGLGAAFAEIAEIAALGDETKSAATSAGAAKTRGGTALARPADLDSSIDLARAYLLSDPGLQEAWEVHRWGLFGATELTARIFPTAMVLEQLGAAGVPLGGRADAVIAGYAEGAYSYFDEPNPMPPDIDVLGALLRLVPHCEEPDRARALLEEPLDWLLRSAPPDGDVPTWIARSAPEAAYAPEITAIMGGDCAGCQLNLLRGLVVHGAERFAPYAQRLLSAVLRKLASVGAGALRFYTGGYAAWALADLGAELTSSTDGALLAALPEIDRIASLLAAREARRSDLGPQGAAMLLLTTPHAPARAAWLDQVLRSQRWDGAWDDEPLYVVPRRGGVSTWYASRTATTSICHRALVSAFSPEES